MDVEASNEPKFCDDEDDLHLSPILPLKISCLRKCSNETVKKSKVENNVVDDGEDDDILISRFKKKKKLTDESFSMIKIKKFVKEQLASVEESIEECHKKGKVKEMRLESLKRDINKCTKELANKKIQVRCVREINQIHQQLLVKIEECSMEFVVKEAQLCLMENLIGEHKLEFKTKEVELHQIKFKENEFRRFMENIDKDCERKKEELRVVSSKVAECNRELRIKEKELDAMKELVVGQENKLESMRKHFEKQVKELEYREKKLEGGMEEFKSKKKVFEGFVKEFESKEREFQGQKEELETEKMCFESRMKELELEKMCFESRVKEFESKEREFLGQKEEFETENMCFESRRKELELEKMCFESRVKEFESKEKQLDDQMKEFESKKGEFEGKVKEYESKKEELKDQKEELISEKMCLESRVKELVSKESQLEGRIKEFESKKGEFEVQVNDLESQKKNFESQVKELESQKKNFESRVKELEPKEREFEKWVRELKSDELQLQSRVKELKANNKHFESQAENFKTKEKKFEGQEKPLIKSVKEEEEELGTQLSPSIEENSLPLVLVPSEKADDNESFTNHILDNLLASSDPSKLVLEIIQNPIVPQCRKEHNTVTIDGDHIALLVQLMRITPHIKLNVREEAMKLALDLKAHMSKNSQAVLGFLLILSIYGLSPSFDKDEVFKLFGFVAQHKIAVDLFETLGFADKASDFVQNLIREEQHIAAVRFICAYDLIDKYQPFNLLRDHMQNAKLISESSCKKTNSIQIKDKARDEEITCLKSVLDCMSDNNLQSESLLKEIQFRNFELIRQKGK